MTERIALITGTTGQDGAYLAEFLLGKGYIVHGIKRRSSSFNTARVDDLYKDPHGPGVKFFLHYGDMTDSTNLIRIIQEVQPTEIYNLAAQVMSACRSRRRNTRPMPMRWAHCAFSKRSAFFVLRTRFGSIKRRPPSCTAWRRRCRSAKPRRFTRARRMPPLNSTPTGSPSIIAKRTGSMRPTAFSSTTKDRHAAKPSFPARSLARWLPLNSACRTSCFSAIFQPSAIGDMRAIMSRACGSSSNSPNPTTTCWRPANNIRYANFAEKAFACAGRTIEWRGSGLAEQGIDKRDGRVLIEIDPRYFRPTETDALLGDPSKARQRLGWRHKVTFDELVREMVESDLAEMRRGGGLRNVHD